MNNFTDDDSIEYYSSVSAANDIYNKLQALCLEPNTSYSYGNMLYGIDIATDSSGQPICYTDDSYSEKVSESEEGYVYYVKPSFYMNSVYSISEAAFDINLEDPYDGEEDSTYTYYDYLIDMEQVIGNLLYGDDFLVSDTGVYVPSLSGVGNTDIVSVAYSQLGQQGGRPYWSWYGFSNRVAWCATFVSWCANQCGYLNSSIPKFSSCLDGINWFKRNNQFASRGYVPKAGDIIFFQRSSNERHVGIVTGSDGSRVYTIEGNSSDSVRANSYSIYYKYILGYGVPIYP
jgi:hypothetical protein